MEVMKKRSVLLIPAIVVMATLFIAAGIYAATMPDVITMNTKEYAKHTKGNVVFPHKKHVTEYGAKCGDCHHDDKGKPLDLKEGDSAKRCVECHTETGKKPKGERLSKAEKIKKYQKEAMHANCVGCHKDYNKKNKLRKNDPKAAPTSCNDCHKKK
jgi:cytochrome c553